MGAVQQQKRMCLIKAEAREPEDRLSEVFREGIPILGRRSDNSIKYYLL